MKFGKFIFAIALAAVLAGCNGLTFSTDNPIGRPQQAAVEQSVKAALTPSLALLERRTCKRAEEPQWLQAGCTPYGTRIALKNGIAKTRTAHEAFRNFVANNPTLDATALYRAVMDSVATLDAIRGG